jgi:hypothetical protein
LKLFVRTCFRFHAFFSLPPQRSLQQHYTLCSPCEYTNFQQVQHTYINIHYMACSAILFRMKMKKTQNVLRIRNGKFLKFFYHRKKNERKAKWRKMYQLSFFFWLVFLGRIFKGKGGRRREKFSLIFYANFEKLKFFLRHLPE